MAVVTINRPGALNSLTRPMMVALADAFRRFDVVDTVAAVVVAGHGRAFFSGIDLTAAEDVFKGDIKDLAADPVAAMVACRKPIVVAIAGFAVTAGFEIALACDLLVAGRDAKFADLYAAEAVAPHRPQLPASLLADPYAVEVVAPCRPLRCEAARSSPTSAPL
ncbi:probable enoyl-CoA hydratase 1, peroxisomal [Ananas comosus]|uniref:Probable enoyl-CoA hydratase 1, peroxisomal n=1 Tax=Ananas comosus TaxID=4615 RepID=A0A6P5F358_ANACO|nr:probable enoyl-CoA hydratase 1, peroxisomal [Ananas comosus]